MIISFLRFCFYASVSFLTLAIVAIFFVEPESVEAGLLVFVIIVNVLVAVSAIFVIKRLYRKMK